jgi:hypothetical protein
VSKHPHIASDGSITSCQCRLLNWPFTLAVETAGSEEWYLSDKMWHTRCNPHCMDLVPSLIFLEAPPLYWFLINKPIWWLPCSRDIAVGSVPTCRLPPNANREPELVVAVWSFPREFFFLSNSPYWLFRCKYGGRRCLWIDCPLYLFASGLAACLCTTQRCSFHHLAQHSDHCLV